MASRGRGAFAAAAARGARDEVASRRTAAHKLISAIPSPLARCAVGAWSRVCARGSQHPPFRFAASHPALRATRASRAAMKLDAAGLAAVVDALPAGGELNHLPRAAALLLLLDGDHAVHDDGAGAAIVVHELQQTTLSLLATRPNPSLAAPAYEAAHWPPGFGHDPDTRVTLPAVPEALVPACAAKLRALGRTVTFMEPCTIWEAPDDLLAQVCAGGAGDARVPLDWGALGARLGLPAGYTLGALAPDDAVVLNAHWKYANGAATEAVIRRCIADYPCVGVRDEAAALAAWVVTRYDGSMGILGTLPAHRGRGLAKAAVKGLMVLQARWVPTLRGDPPAECDPALPPLPRTLAVPSAPTRAALARMLRPHCHIADYNTPSARLFAALGFACVGRCTWLVSSAPSARFVFRPLTLPLSLGAALKAVPGGCACPNHTGGRCSTAAATPADPTAPWLAHESPAVLAAAPRELVDLLGLIQASYRQDDAFFVDQWRTCASDVWDAAAGGVFFLGYRLRHRRGSAGGEGGERFGLATAPYPAPVACSVAGEGEGEGGAEGAAAAALPPAAAHPDWAEAPGELLVSVHLSFTEGDEGEAAAAAAAAGASASAAPPRPGRTVHLSLLTIRPDLKKGGLASRVLEFALATAAGAYGATAAEVHVVSVKPWLLEFYVRKGFAVVGEDPWPPALQHQLLRPTFFHRCRKALV